MLNLVLSKVHMFLVIPVYGFSIVGMCQETLVHCSIMLNEHLIEVINIDLRA